MLRVSRNELMISRSWAALLTPTLLTRTVGASGWELDITSSTFESMLQQELVQSGVALGKVEFLTLRHGHSREPTSSRQLDSNS